MDTPSIPPQGPTSPIEPQVKESKVGPIIGIIIVVIVLIVGALYFWGERLARENNAIPNAQTTTLPQEPTDPVADSLKTQSDSDDFVSIEQDLSATSMDGLSNDFQAIPNQ